MVTLHNVSVAGSLAALRNLTRLTTLSLVNTDLPGTLAHLRGLARLTALALADSPVGGSVAALSALGLQTLVLIGTNIEGPLAALGNVTSLRDLTLLRSRVEGPVGALRPLRGLMALSLGHAPRLDADLSVVGGMPGLRVLRLQALPLRGSLDALEGLRSMRELVLGPYVTAPAAAPVAGSLASLGQMQDLETLYLSGVAVQGLFWALHPLPALRFVAVADSPVAGSLASAAGLRRLVSLELRDVPLEGRLDPLASLNGLRYLTLQGTGVTGDLRALPQALAWADVGGNALFARGGNVSVDLPGCWYVNLSHNGIVDGQLEALRTAGTAIVDLRGNHFRCPLQFLPGLTLVTSGCHEDMVVFGAMLAFTGVAVVAIVVLMAWLDRTAGEAPPGGWGHRGRTVVLHAIRLLCLVDVVTDVVAGASMLRATAAPEDRCTPFNEFAQFQALVPRHKSYESRIIVEAAAAMGAAATDGAQAAPDFAAWVRTLETEGWPASDVAPLVARFASTCRQFRHCEYAESRCQPAARDPYWWFRLLLIIDIVVFGSKELLKVGCLCYFALRKVRPPERLQWFCATSPASVLLCYWCPSIRDLVDRQPTRRDLAWQIVYDLFLEDIPQLVLQVVFLKAITPVGLTTVEFLSMFFTGLSLLTITCRCTSKQMLYRVTRAAGRTLMLASCRDLTTVQEEHFEWPAARRHMSAVAESPRETTTTMDRGLPASATWITTTGGSSASLWREGAWSPEAPLGNPRRCASDAETEPQQADPEADETTPGDPLPHSPPPSGGLPTTPERMRGNESQGPRCTPAVPPRLTGTEALDPLSDPWIQREQHHQSQ